MLPFASIACTQCRSFAIRSFASAASAASAATASTSKVDRTSSSSSSLEMSNETPAYTLETHYSSEKDEKSPLLTNAQRRRLQKLLKEPTTRSDLEALMGALQAGNTSSFYSASSLRDLLHSYKLGESSIEPGNQQHVEQESVNPHWSDTKATQSQTPRQIPTKTINLEALLGTASASSASSFSVLLDKSSGSAYAIKPEKPQSRAKQPGIPAYGSVQFPYLQLRRRTPSSPSSLGQLLARREERKVAKSSSLEDGRPELPDSLKLRPLEQAAEVAVVSQLHRRARKVSSKSRIGRPKTRFAGPIRLRPIIIKPVAGLSAQPSLFRTNTDQPRRSLGRKGRLSSMESRMKKFRESRDRRMLKNFAATDKSSDAYTAGDKLQPTSESGFLELAIGQEAGQDGGKKMAQTVSAPSGPADDTSVEQDRPYLPPLESGERWLSADHVDITTVTPTRQVEVARLAHGLQRVLFEPGIHWLQDPKTKFFNYPSAIQHVANRADFDFDRLPSFVRPSQDPDLKKLLKSSGRKFAGSTSSLTSALSQIYFALNGCKLLNTQTPAFKDAPRDFAMGARLPASIDLRFTDDKTYLIDADKTIEREAAKSEADLAAEKGMLPENVLSELGHVLERQLTMEPERFSRFLKSSPNPFQPSEMRDQREAYHYSASRHLVMRSQLDCQDDRLAKKTFDIKTRATVAIRQDILNHEQNEAYTIWKGQGQMESFEKEKYDLIRSAYLKYSMQVRIGNMDGIFLAYHSTGRVFGFEYQSLEDIDKLISGSTEESSQAFSLGVGLLENILKRITRDMPEQTLRLHFKGSHGNLQVFAEAMPSASGAEDAQAARHELRYYDISVINYLNDKEVMPDSPVDFMSVAQQAEDETTDASSSSSSSAEWPKKSTLPVIWAVKYTISESRDQDFNRSQLKKLRAQQRVFQRNVLLPQGLTMEEIEYATKQKKKTSSSGTATDRGEGKSEKAAAAQDDAAEAGAESEGDLREGSTDSKPVWSTAFRPREGVTYTTKPHSLAARVRKISARHRAILEKAARKTQASKAP